MARPSKYCPELPERAARLVFDMPLTTPVAVGDDSIWGREDWRTVEALEAR
jgi:hypothetical protein